jgi:lipoprotein NlpI
LTGYSGTDPAAWSFAIVRFYRGEIDRAALMAAAEVDPATAANNRCEANFYMGQLELMHGNRKDAQPLLQAVIDTCPPSLFEVWAARADLAELARH